MTCPPVERSSKGATDMSIVEVRIPHQERHQGQVRRDHLRGTKIKQLPWAALRNLLRITIREGFFNNSPHKTIPTHGVSETTEWSQELHANTTCLG